jgi:hypothetical protein
MMVEFEVKIEALKKEFEMNLGKMTGGIPCFR